jgi:sigma-B regulation protein RsbU (phosphoserine phosphatase)
MFVTVWLGILNIVTGEVEYANGGHTGPRLLHADGTGEEMSDGQPPPQVLSVHAFLF